MRYFLPILFCVLFFSVKAQQDSLNGFRKFYYPGGAVSSEGTMKDGKPDGFWRSYYPTGIIKSEGNRKNFILDSTWFFYTPEGKLSEKIEYLYGKKNGYSCSYFYPADTRSDTGILISKEMYVNNFKEGISYYYYENGKLKEVVNYKKGIRDGASKTYAEDGRLIRVDDYWKGSATNSEKINRYTKEGRKDGLWREYFDNGKIKKEEQYKDGVLNGIYREYDESGSTMVRMRYSEGRMLPDEEIDTNVVQLKSETDNKGRVIYSGAFRDSVPIGVHRWYDTLGRVVASKIYNENGTVNSEGIINADGKKTGTWKYYDAKGSVIAQGKYVKNKREGKWEFYKDDGKIIQTGNYLNDLYEGEWTWQYENGKLLRKEEYQEGRLFGAFMEYDKEGNLMIAGHYTDDLKDSLWYYNVGDYQEKGRYVLNKKDGKWKAHFTNGKLCFEGSYIQGNPDGKHYLYYDNGTMKEERIFELGSREKTWKKYDRNGALYMTITYKDNKEHRINGQIIK